VSSRRSKVTCCRTFTAASRRPGTGHRRLGERLRIVAGTALSVLHPYRCVRRPYRTRVQLGATAGRGPAWCRTSGRVCRASRSTCRSASPVSPAGSTPAEADVRRPRPRVADTWHRRRLPAKVPRAVPRLVVGMRADGRYMRGSFGQFATAVGAAAQGRELIAEARGQLPRSAPPIALLWLDALEATALAHLGERSALAILDAAERRMTKAGNTEPVWPWLFHFDERELAAYRAVVAGRLGHHRIAETYFAVAERAGSSPKQQAVSTVAR
jgi:hypothetical protein